MNVPELRETFSCTTRHARMTYNVGKLNKDFKVVMDQTPYL